MLSKPPVFAANYEKQPGELLLFQGRLRGPDLKIVQPIIAQIPGYNKANIYASTFFAPAGITNALNSGAYPLPKPIDSTTDQKRTSWLIYAFLEMEPE